MPITTFPDGSGTAIWGGIAGTLSNQTDLQDALDAKYDVSNIQSAVLEADFPKTNDTFANVTDLTLTLTAGHWYRVTGYLDMFSDVVGSLFDFNGGSATITGMNGMTVGLDDGTIALLPLQNLTDSLISSYGAAAFYQVDFIVQINAGGTLIPRFRQASTDATPNFVKKYSTIQAIDVTP